MKVHIFLLSFIYLQLSFAQDWLRLDSYEAHLRDIYTVDDTAESDSKPSRFLRSVSSYENFQDSDSTKKEEVVIFDQDDTPRDKRTLGLIVQGLASALGYTLSPVQVGSLPNPSPPPAAAPKPSKAPPSRPPSPAAPPSTSVTPAKGPSAPAGPVAPAAAPAGQPRQRETIRLTGLVNFGANANVNLPGQLARYEQLFHGTPAGVTSAPAAPPASSTPPAPPASSASPPPSPSPAAKKPTPPAPLPTLNLPKIPSPIVFNLSPLLPPSRPPVSKPSDTPAMPKSSGPVKQEVEIEYRKKEDSEKLNVESKEIEGERNLYLELPGVKNGQDPNWQKGYDQRLKELEERQKEYADRLRYHEDRLAKEKEGHENTDERFANRETEIAERDKAHSAEIEERGEGRERQRNIEERPRTEVEDSEKENEEEDRPWQGYERPTNSQNEEEHTTNKYENEDDTNSKQYSDYDEEPNKYYEYEDPPPSKANNYNDEKEDALPISKDKSIPKSDTIQNSYGESLEDQGHIDENIADYFIKFKDPKTGLYVPEKTQNFENYKKEKEPWWKASQDDFDSRLDNLREEYKSLAPKSKYEEYELEDEPEKNEKPAVKKSEDNDEANESANSEPINNNRNKDHPDYTGVFGVYEPHSHKNFEPVEIERENSPASDEVEASKSESKKDSRSNDETKKTSENVEKESSTDDEEIIPFYNFDFKSFAPYYSPIKFIYGSDDAEQGIPRIRSYNNQRDSQMKEDAAKDPATEKPVEKKEPIEELKPIIGPPEKLAIKSLHDGESKQLHAWPAPFDYVFDSTEQTNVAELPRLRSTLMIEVPNPDSSRDSFHPYLRESPEVTSASYKTRRNENEPTSFHGYNGFYEYSRPSSTLASKTLRAPHNSLPHNHNHNIREESETRVNSGETNPNQASSHDKLINNHHQYTPREYQFSDYQQHGYKINHQPNNANRQNSGESSTLCADERTQSECLRRYQQIESQQRLHTQDLKGIPIPREGDQLLPRKHFGPGNSDLRNRGADFGQEYTTSEPRLSGRRFDESSNGHILHQKQDQLSYDRSSLQPEDKSALKFEDPKSAHDFFGFSKNDYDFDNVKSNDKLLGNLKNVEAMGANDEVLDLLVVSEPTPYHYDEGLTKFTVEPESDTEKVKVKEYRNKVATVTVSERKQLSPEGPVHLIGYTHQY